MTQPKWKFVDNLGDAHPLEYGGIFLYVDETGEYPPELERLEPPCDDHRCEGAEFAWGTKASEDEEHEAACEHYEVTRVVLEPLQEVRDEDTMHLVDGRYKADWPHPVASYRPWFADDLASVADSAGAEVSELRTQLLAEDAKQRAYGYLMIAQHHGWGALGGEPRMFAKEALLERYTQGEV
jgi:hypothetical protein